MTIEDRLRDALGPYRDGDAPRELWERIEEQTQRRRWVRAPLVLAAAAVLAVLAVVGASMAQRSDTTDQVTAGDPTREQYLVRADQLCEELGARIDDAKVVFPTATGYAVVADQVRQIAEDALAEAQATAVPPELIASAAANVDQLRLALAAAQQVRRAADAGDTAGAESALRAFGESMARVADHLAADGATGCAATEVGTR